MANPILESSQTTLDTQHLDLNWVRAQFPSLSQQVNGKTPAFLDGPGGTQVPQGVIDAISDYFRTNNANTCGAYATSRATDQVPGHWYEAKGITAPRSNWMAEK